MKSTRKHSQVLPASGVSVEVVDAEEMIDQYRRGEIPRYAMTISVSGLKRWAVEYNVPEGVLHGVRIIRKNNRRGDEKNG